MDGKLEQTIDFRRDANQGRMCLWTWKGRVSENLLKDRAIKAGSGKWKKGTVSGWRKGAGNMDNECSKKQANSRKVKAPHASTFCCMLHQLAKKKQNTFCPPWIMETCLQWKALSDLNDPGLCGINQLLLSTLTILLHLILLKISALRLSLLPLPFFPVVVW